MFPDSVVGGISTCNGSAKLCASPKCDNAVLTKLACPKCLTLGLPPSYFCCQTCFKSNYATHCKIHKLAKQQTLNGQNHSGGSRRTDNTIDGITYDLKDSIAIRLSLPNWARHFRFTGDLRPTLLSPKRTLPSSIRRPDYAVRCSHSIY